jgi:ABC-2 type transport system ATP-binding protein
MAETALFLQNVCKDYPGRRVLDKINFQVTEGKVHGFLGPNGAGKSTTMKIIVGLLKPTLGRMEIFNSSKKIEKNKIGYLPEQLPLYFDMTVKEYLYFVSDIHGIKKRKYYSNVIEKCGIHDVQDRLIGHLSKGYKQRVGLAQSLIYNAPLLILDEPMSGLDPQAIVEMRKLIRSLEGEHTILFSTHQLHEVTLLCQEMTIISEGKIIKTGPLSELDQSKSEGKEIVLETKLWNSHIAYKLENEFPVKKIRVNSEDGCFKVRINLDSNKDLRTEIGIFLFQNNCGVLSMNQRQLNAEDIFTDAMSSLQ